MTTIRISRLPEIKNDRVSKDDFVILNDGDLVTSKISFGEFCIGIGAQDLEYSGDQLFTGSVVFEGSVTGDFYNKDQTYSKTEINQLISNLEDYNVLQDARVSALVTLSGLPELTEDLGTFPILSNCIPAGLDSNGFAADLDNLTVKEAIEALRLYTKTSRCQICDLQDQVLTLRLEVDELKLIVENILEIINGGGGGNPDPGLPPPDGILPWLQWLTLIVTEHEKELADHEARILILEAYKDDLETIIIPDLTDRLKINDDENAALIKLSGMPALSENLGNFASVPVIHPNNNSSFESPYQLTNTTVKKAFENTYHEMRTRAPYTNPIFVEKITGPSFAPSVIPFYHDNVSQLNLAMGDDGKSISGGGVGVEGSFAYTPVDTRPGKYNEPKAWVRATTEWLQVLTSGNFYAIADALNLRVGKNDADVSVVGPNLEPIVGNGFLYVQFDPGKPTEPPLLKVKGVNTAPDPRP